MPTVKTQKTYFGGKEFRMRVNVNKDGLFTAMLPGWSREALGKDRVEADTLKAAMRAFDDEKKRYGKMLQARRRVIRYVFEINDKTHRYSGQDERDDLTFGVGKGVQFGVANMIETAHADADGKILRQSYTEDNKQPYAPGYQYSRFRGMESTIDDIQTIEWSQEREDWFVALCRAMDVLIEKLKTLDEDQQLLLTAVESGSLLTFAGNNPE